MKLKMQVKEGKLAQDSQLNEIFLLIQLLLDSVYDPLLVASKIVDFVHNHSMEAKDRIFGKFASRGIPPEFLKPLKQNTPSVWRLTLDQASVCSKYCISASNAQYFSPNEGKDADEDSLSFIFSKMQRSKRGSKLASAAERNFFESEVCKSQGVEIRRNQHTYRNGMVPFIVATPDGLGYSKPGLISTVVEIKTTLKPLKLADLREQTRLNKTIGLVFPDEDPTSSPVLRPGHCWRTQLLAQSVVLRVTETLLALVLTDGYVVIKTSFTLQDQARYIENLLERYSSLALHLLSRFGASLNKHTECRRGRKRKLTPAERIRNFGQVSPFSNLQ